ncbi:MAG TPA: TIGR03118 family protein, partial [Candidatus Acidoferrales bacterium]|nr:TIGR03118 family protein [Candidatus Acidoferrales bacterium]
MKSLLKTMASIGGLLIATAAFSSNAAAQYTRKDLVTDVGANGTVADANLKNAWGMASSGGGSLWVSANDTGKALLFNIVNNAGGVSATINPLVVTIPSLTTGEPGSPTGIVANIGAASEFLVTGVNPVSGKTVTARAAFLFATLDGTISGWNPNVLPTEAVIGANRSAAGAIYTGLTTASSGGQTFLYAADGGPNRRIDVFDGTFQLHSFSDVAFVDPNVPRKFTPYGIQTICQGSACNIWVTYTALGNAQSGFISEF